MEPDICRYCYKKIKNRDELVTAFRWMEVKPFHYLCYQEIQKETNLIWLSWKPLNGWEGSVTFLLLAGFAIWFLFTEFGGVAGDIAGILALYPLFLRILSYFLYERKLEKLK